MKNVAIVDLDDNSYKIKESLQNFYGEKAKVTIIRLTDKPLNVVAFFFNGTKINSDNKKLFDELINTNKDCNVIAYFGVDETMNPRNRMESHDLSYKRLEHKFRGRGVYYNYKIWIGTLLKIIWCDKNLFLSFLVLQPPPPRYFPPVTPMDEWVEY